MVPECGTGPPTRFLNWCLKYVCFVFSQKEHIFHYKTFFKKNAYFAYFGHFSVSFLYKLEKWVTIQIMDQQKINLKHFIFHLKKTHGFALLNQISTCVNGRPTHNIILYWANILLAKQ